MPTRSSDTVKVRFLDRDRVVDELKRIALALAGEFPNVLEVRLFGSLARGNYAPGSDADVLIILREDARPMLDRIPDFLRRFWDVSVPVEVFPYTGAELEGMRRRGISFVNSIDREGIRLA